MSRDPFGECTSRVCYQHWVGGGQAVAQHTTMHRTAPVTKNYLAQDMNCAKAKKLPQGLKSQALRNISKAEQRNITLLFSNLLWFYTHTHSIIHFFHYYFSLNLKHRCNVGSNQELSINNCSPYDQLFFLRISGVINQYLIWLNFHHSRNKFSQRKDSFNLP